MGNTAMHMPQVIGPPPGMTTMATKMMKKEISKLGFPGVSEFLDHLVDSGANLWACQMSADMMKLESEDLYERVSGIIGATEFMEMSEDAQIIFILKRSPAPIRPPFGVAGRVWEARVTWPEARGDSMRRLAVLVLSLALVAAACGDDDGGSVDTEATTPVATATTASAATTAPTATSAPATTTTAAPTTTVAPGNPLVALAAAFAGDYTGAWNNTTFGSTGPIETSIVVDEVAETVTVTSDLGGFVFGGPDPDPTVTVIDLSAEPPYETSSELMGDSTFEISEEGMLTFTAPAVPGLGGLTFVMEGIPDPAGFPMTYRIENPDGSIFAEGTVDMAPA